MNGYKEPNQEGQTIQEIKTYKNGHVSCPLQLSSELETSDLTTGMSKKGNASSLSEESNLLTTKEIEKLETWKAHSKFGDFVEGTYILPCKTFLDEPKWQKHLSPLETFRLEDLVKYLHTKGLKLSYIIDLNRSFDYYDFPKLQKDNPLLKDTVHKKFCLENASIPEEKDISEILNIF